jgi:hypothetical protein
MVMAVRCRQDHDDRKRCNVQAKLCVFGVVSNNPAVQFGMLRGPLRALLRNANLFHGALTLVRLLDLIGAIK